MYMVRKVNLEKENERIHVLGCLKPPSFVRNIRRSRLLNLHRPFASSLLRSVHGSSTIIRNPSYPAPGLLVPMCLHIEKSYNIAFHNRAIRGIVDPELE